MFKISDGFQRIRCKACLQAFKSVSELEKHKEKKHQNTFRSYNNQNFGFSSLIEKKLSCVWCEQKFATIDSVRGHVRVVHKYNCNDCMKIIKTFHAFLIHSKTCKFAQENIVYFQKHKLLKN